MWNVGGFSPFYTELESSLIVVVITALLNPYQEQQGIEQRRQAGINNISRYQLGAEWLWGILHFWDCAMMDDTVLNRTIAGKICTEPAVIQNSILLKIDFVLLLINMYHSSSLGHLLMLGQDGLLLWGSSAALPNKDRLMLNYMCQREALSHEDFFIGWSQPKRSQWQLAQSANMRSLSGSCVPATLPPCWRKTTMYSVLFIAVRMAWLLR